MKPLKAMFKASYPKTLKKLVNPKLFKSEKYFTRKSILKDKILITEDKKTIQSNKVMPYNTKLIPKIKLFVISLAFFALK